MSVKEMKEGTERSETRKPKNSKDKKEQDRNARKEGGPKERNDELLVTEDAKKGRRDGDEGSAR